MKIHKLAGIDIGSNSVRLLVSNVIESGETIMFKKSSLTRLPIRLGPDAFGEGRIGESNLKRLIAGMSAYRKIMEVHGVEKYRACATSALRESKNGIQVVERIYRESGVNIELISGKEEARMIFSSDMIGDVAEAHETFLYIDVGGGSTELTLFHKGEIRNSRSFKIGTIRLLKDLVKKKRWEEMKEWIQEKTEDFDEVLMVGSGGNINRTFKLAQKRKGETMTLKGLRGIREQILNFDDDQRMIEFDLNPDRTDVLPHALRIYINAMKWAGAEEMIVPKKGLADGIVRFLYREHFQ
ncbi:Ppx/GppA phosphatase family protein [Croceimicrobium hydrocarbonivorans]|uniref:Ethanolamine ammonia-lyase reactivating factor EutA n=1 Tax=Croceimicrobium hydrocarbonivorans TaxID=2761580 RepID=A0A7H0VG09_9FLAO|nr:ethanolamine ammonia-lyase reactivating factor EutA [Croceimicrobium hydrocarbonivorans]QNR24657.1 ethanolamine ammonia-lyase reactivating factor EutA [Croceimicrobium hydrocarbonivorans]